MHSLTPPAFLFPPPQESRSFGVGMFLGRVNPQQVFPFPHGKEGGDPKIWGGAFWGCPPLN